MDNRLLSYEAQNLLQKVSEHDPFTEERYQQFAEYLRDVTGAVLDVGCNTGRGGLRLKQLLPGIELHGLDCVQTRLAQIPGCYGERVCGLSTEIPADDLRYAAVVAGEFLEHLYPADVDKTLCEFQRILRIGGLLLMTTPNPGYLLNRIRGTSVLGTSHLTQHHPDALRFRVRMHGFSRVKVLGSGRVSRYIGQRFPVRSVYGSYLIIARKI